MNIIASASKSWGIGKNNELLFHIKEDMKYFRETTTGNVVVMGRKTLDSLPGGRPLKNRINIVLTRDCAFERDGVTAVHSVGELLDEIKKYNSETFVIGGGEIYNTLLPHCKRAYITRINADKDADTFLPDLDKSGDWRIISETAGSAEGGLEYTFTVYERI